MKPDDDTHQPGASIGVAATVPDSADPDVGDSVAPSTTRQGVAPTGVLATGAMVGEYRIEAKLGEGGMGTVYGAVHPLIGKRAAIKVLKRQLCNDPEAVERFVLEARSVNQIGHPNIVDIFAFGELGDGRSYFVMEWLRGETLGQRMQRGRLAFGECIEVLDAIILGLEAAHDQGIIHRDLKPDNVFLVEVRGQRAGVKLLDFGIAKLTGGDDQRIERTRTGALIGTPQYISPEQARGLAIDHRADLYSLGVMAFEMFTGRPPFQADTAMDMIAKHLHDPPPRPSTMGPLPAELDRVIHELLDKDASNRPELADLRRVLDEVRTASVNVALLGTVPDATLPAAVRATRTRRGAWRAGLVVAGVVAAAGTWWALTRDRGTAPRPPIATEPPPVAPDAPASGVTPPAPASPTATTAAPAPTTSPAAAAPVTTAGGVRGPKPSLARKPAQPGSDPGSGPAAPAAGSGSGGAASTPPSSAPPPPPVVEDIRGPVSPYPKKTP